MSCQWAYKSLAHKYSMASTLSKDDLYQIGLWGACKAIGRYDPSKGTKVSSFLYAAANWAIRQGIRDIGRTVRLPRVIAEWRHVCFRLVKVEGHTPEEAAAILNQKKQACNQKWDTKLVTECLQSYQEETRVLDAGEDDEITGKHARKPLYAEAKPNWLDEVCFEYQMDKAELVRLLDEVGTNYNLKKLTRLAQAGDVKHPTIEKIRDLSMNLGKK